MANTPIVVIGASAGGVEAVTRLLRNLAEDFPAAVFVAMHFPPESTSVLPQIITRAARLRAEHARDGEPIVSGRVYVAPPDKHLIVLREQIHLAYGPRENGNRPAIDPMFRSAAVAHGPRVVAVVLTGNLDDGTAGLLAVKRGGGTTIVQDPSDALFRSMPQSAIDHVVVDHILPLAAIPATLTAVVSRIASDARPESVTDAATKDDARRETKYDELDLGIIEDVAHHPGRPSQFGCPDCGGVLWEIQDGQLVRFRCRVGHAWTSESLRTKQSEQLDAALWTALRALEESASITRMMGNRAQARGNDILAAKYDRDARSAETRARMIRDVLMETSPARSAQRLKKAEPTRG